MEVLLAKRTKLLDRIKRKEQDQRVFIDFWEEQEFPDGEHQLTANANKMYDMMMNGVSAELNEMIKRYKHLTGEIKRMRGELESLRTSTSNGQLLIVPQDLWHTYMMKHLDPDSVFNVRCASKTLKANLGSLEIILPIVAKQLDAKKAVTKRLFRVYLAPLNACCVSFEMMHASSSVFVESVEAWKEHGDAFKHMLDECTLRCTTYSTLQNRLEFQSRNLPFMTPEQRLELNTTAMKTAEAGEGCIGPIRQLIDFVNEHKLKLKLKIVESFGNRLNNELKEVLIKKPDTPGALKEWIRYLVY